MSIKLRYLYRAYRYRYRVDRAELRFLCERLGAGQVAVDIGCHKGAYTYWMHRRVGVSGRVFAFEPQPKQVAYLREVCTAMRYDNVTIVPMAVSDVTGKLLLHAGVSTHGASLESRNATRGVTSEQPEFDSRSSRVPPFLVDVTTLDAYFVDRRQRPNFVKIDVEGHELAVLRGAHQVLIDSRPTLLLECEARHRPDGEVRPVFEYVESLGYTGSFFTKGKRLPLAEFDPSVHQRIGPDSQRLPQEYANNFVFEYSA